MRSLSRVTCRAAQPLGKGASPSRQPSGPEEDEPGLDEYDLHSLSHRHLGQPGAPKSRPSVPPSTGPQGLTHLQNTGAATDEPRPLFHTWKQADRGRGGRKGRTKREAAANTNRPSPGGHERKLVTKLQNAERKKRGARP
ncbi:nuclear protein 1 isoform X2 [Choloepus didactylus]|uniref:nuclear protein 1 isoform X2 n=1 Tax=Choloepus didactylus TaxID=27675 RepID=UPI00189CA1C4|nr:nuclear protein 1 isoform X2 [Choloepus didactylus]